MNHQDKDKKSNMNWKLIIACIVIVGAVYLYLNPDVINRFLGPTKEITQIAGNNIKQASNNLNQYREIYENITKCNNILNEIM